MENSNFHIMTYSKRISDIIKIRYSCRSYQNTTIAQETQEEIEAACSGLKVGLFNESTRFNLISINDWPKNKVRIGTYGMIVNPRYFLVGTIENTKMAYVSYGYLLEHLILKVTELGLQTCWLGYFGKDFFDAYKLHDNEIMPAISTIGYPTEVNTLSDMVLKKGAWDLFSQYFKKPRQRKPIQELFFEGSLNRPSDGKIAGDYFESLEMVRLAPSAGNKQPWRIVKDSENGAYHFFMNPSNRKGYIKKKLHEIDMGIALCHFDLTARANHLRGEWKIKDPGIQIPANHYYIASWV